MQRFNDPVIKVAKNVGSLYPNDAGYVETVNMAMDILEGLPRDFNFEFNLDLKPEELGKDQFETLLNLHKNMNGWVGFFLYTNAYKAYQLLKELIKSLNSHCYLPAMTLTRSLIEYAATMDYHAKQLMPKISELNRVRNVQSLREVIQPFIEVIGLCHRYARLTRFNWRAYVNGDMKSFFKDWSHVNEEDRQINILTLIDKLPQEEKGARFFYEMLSEFAHPNVSSHALVIEKASLINSNRARYVLSRDAENAELLFIVIHCIAIPTKVSLNIITEWIKALTRIYELNAEWIKKGERMLGKR